MSKRAAARLQNFRPSPAATYATKAQVKREVEQMEKQMKLGIAIIKAVRS